MGYYVGAHKVSCNNLDRVPKVMICVRGGVVQGVKATDQVEVLVLDYDNKEAVDAAVIAGVADMYDLAEAQRYTIYEHMWRVLPHQSL